MRLAGKTGIVTAPPGNGRAGALRFAREGAQVAVVDVDAAGSARGERDHRGGRCRARHHRDLTRTKTRARSCGTRQPVQGPSISSGTTSPSRAGLGRGHLT